jgi:uncharacterized protein with HEPN domain
VFSDDERARGWIEDIVENADRIAEYIAGIDAEAFAADAKTRDAVERCIERISEAAVRLGPERLAQIAPETPLHEVRGLGNVLRHEYQRVNARLIWDTAASDVPALRESCVKALG